MLKRNHVFLQVTRFFWSIGRTSGDAIGKAYWESKGLNENTRFDYLEIVDLYGNKGLYGVQHQDMEHVLKYLLTAAPNMKLDPVPRSM